jgi:hypothetical protein
MLVVTIAIALLMTACGGQAAVQQSTDKSAGAQVSNATATAATNNSAGITQSSAPSQGLTVQGSQGQKVTISGEVPDALKSFPVPDGFTISNEGNGSITANEGSVAVAAWSGTGTSQNIADFYSKSLKQQGWSEQFSINTPTGGSLGYTKGDSQATITIDTSDSKTTKVSVALGTNLATPTQSSSSAANPAQNAAASVATVTPVAIQVSSSGGIPPALSNVPVPPGFSVKANGSGTVSSAQGNVAAVNWSGNSSLSDTVAFYKKAMAGDWTEASFIQADAGFVATYTSLKDPKVNLVITASKTNTGTDIAAVLTTAAQ